MTADGPVYKFSLTLQTLYVYRFLSWQRSHVPATLLLPPDFHHDLKSESQKYDEGHVGFSFLWS